MNEDGWTGTVGCESSDCGSQVVNRTRYIGIAQDTSRQSCKRKDRGLHLVGWGVLGIIQY